MKKTMDVIKSSIHYRTNALPVKLSDVISIVDSATDKNPKTAGESLPVISSLSVVSSGDNVMRNGNGVIFGELISKQWSDR